MVIDSIRLPRPRATTVIKYERLQRLSELRIKLGERFAQRALAHTRRAGNNNQTSLSFIGHVRILIRAWRYCFLGRAIRAAYKPALWILISPKATGKARADPGCACFVLEPGQKQAPLIDGMGSYFATTLPELYATMCSNR